MHHLHFTICALFITIFILVVFITKKKIKTIDNTIYLSMLILSLIDCILMISVICMGYGLFGTELIAIIFNKLDFITYIFWSSLLFIYNFNAINSKNIEIKKVSLTIIIINVLFSTLILMLPLKVFNENEVMYAYGPATIALIADAVAGSKEKYLNEGFIDYISKPFNREQIKEKLASVFSESKISIKNSEEKDKKKIRII